MSKPTLLYCVPYGDDTGAGVRGVAIANRLASRFRIVMLIEGILPLDRAMTVSSEIELVQLPVLGVDRWRSDASVQWLRHSNDPAFSRGTIREVYSRLDPCLVVIENFPFVHSELGNALMSMIADSKSQGSVMPLVVSVTDAIAGGLRAEKSHDDKIAALLNERFDAVLVASDTEFARLEEFFRPCVALTTPVYHTGFVPNDRQNMPSSEARERRVLVSAGDGSRGGRLYRAAVEAHRPLWDVDKLEMTIVAGPSLPTDEWHDLVKAAQRLPGLALVRSVPDLGAELAKVRWAVCPADYNTACDLIATNVLALVVPGRGSDATQQVDRARKLASEGFCRILMAHHLNGASVANAIHRLIRFEPARAHFDLDGAKKSANLIQKLWISENVRSMLLIRSGHTS